MKIDIFSINKEMVGALELNEQVFACEFRPDLLNLVVNWQLAKRRLGTHQTKEVGDLNASTRKIYAQKGTGRARHGSVKSPQFRGGATVFGPHVRDHSFKLNKKVRTLALKVALSSLLSKSSLFVIDSLKLNSPKTKELQAVIKSFGFKSVLMIDNIVEDNLRNAASNLYKVDVLPVSGLNVYDLLNHEAVLITADAVKSIENRLA
jgi:large subunit ribosomal protein L4